MKQILYFILSISLFLGCSKEPQLSLQSLPSIEDENYSEVLSLFINNCKSKKAKKIYANLCVDAKSTKDAKIFIKNNFEIYKLNAGKSLLTGYYEPELKGSYIKSKKYKYPIYETPKDLLVVNLSSIYPELKNYRLRGRLDGNVVVPYYSRKELKKIDLDANVICYCDSKIDLFFLEVQGSGRVKLDNGESIYIGYDNQNGHKYSSIGKYLINIGEIKKENISLQTIKEWFKNNPSRVDEVLNHNDSLVFFKQREQGATGSLGLKLTALRSIAVDPAYISLGSMLYLSSSSPEIDYNRVVFAQDSGGAIKGILRADIFLGFGKNAGKIAGKLQAPLKLWLLKPKMEK